jgi:hypothetical protein
MWNGELDGAVHLVEGAHCLVVYFGLVYAIRENHHRNANGQKENEKCEEQRDRFGEGGDRHPGG